VPADVNTGTGSTSQWQAIIRWCATALPNQHQASRARQPRLRQQVLVEEGEEAAPRRVDGRLVVLALAQLQPAIMMMIMIIMIVIMATDDKRGRGSNVRRTTLLCTRGRQAGAARHGYAPARDAPGGCVHEGMAHGRVAVELEGGAGGLQRLLQGVDGLRPEGRKRQQGIDSHR